MALSDYKFCEEGEVQAIKNAGSWSVLVDNKIACAMSSGGVHRFRSQTEAEVFGNQLVRGWTGGTFLSADVDDHITA